MPIQLDFDRKVGYLRLKPQTFSRTQHTHFEHILFLGIDAKYGIATSRSTPNNLLLSIFRIQIWMQLQNQKKKNIKLWLNLRILSGTAIETQSGAMSCSHTRHTICNYIEQSTRTPYRRMRLLFAVDCLFSVLCSNWVLTWERIEAEKKNIVIHSWRAICNGIHNISILLMPIPGWSFIFINNIECIGMFRIEVCRR